MIGWLLNALPPMFNAYTGQELVQQYTRFIQNWVRTTTFDCHCHRMESWVNRSGISDHGYVPFVLITISSFPHSWLITRFVTRVTRRVALVEQELPILPEHLSSPSLFSGIHVAWSLVFCVMFCRSLVVL